MNSYDGIPKSMGTGELIVEQEVTQETLNSQLDAIDRIREEISKYTGQYYTESNREALEKTLKGLEDALNIFETDFHDMINNPKVEVEKETAEAVQSKYLKEYRDWISSIRESLNGLSIHNLINDPEAPAEGVADELLEEDTEEVQIPRQSVANDESDTAPAVEAETGDEILPPMMMEGEDYGLPGNDKPGEESIAAK